MSVPEIDLSDPAVLTDPFAAYGAAREQSPVARLVAPGLGGLWAVLRHADGRAALTDSRFRLGPGSYQRPAVPEHCLPYLRTMGEVDGPEHTRLRRAVSPSFTARRAADFRTRIEPLVDRLLDDLPTDGPTDLHADFARPLPMDVICELVGIPDHDRPQWREYGAAVAAGHGQAFADAIPAIIAGARDAVASPGDGLLAELVAPSGSVGSVGSVGGLGETDLVALVWHLVLAGQTPTNLITNAVSLLLDHPAHLAVLREEPHLMPAAVEEITRWYGPQLLTVPRISTSDVDVSGVVIPAGEPMTVSIASVNRDPRVFDDPEVLDFRRPIGTITHLGYGHGPHFCLGAALARVQTEVALTALLLRFPNLAVASRPARIPDPGTWRLHALPVHLQPVHSGGE